MFWLSVIQIVLFILLISILYPLFKKILSFRKTKKDREPSKRVVLIVTTISFLVLIIGAICIYNFVNQPTRPMYILLLGVTINICQKVILNHYKR